MLILLRCEVLQQRGMDKMERANRSGGVERLEGDHLGKSHTHIRGLDMHAPVHRSSLRVHPVQHGACNNLCPQLPRRAHVYLFFANAVDESDFVVVYAPEILCTIRVPLLPQMPTLTCPCLTASCSPPLVTCPASHVPAHTLPLKG